MVYYSYNSLILFSFFFLFAGRLSNPGFEDEHIGSPNRLRELGFRPRSGLWQRKTGRFGRKIKQPPPMSEPKRRAPEPNYIRHTLPHIRI